MRSFQVGRLQRGWSLRTAGRDCDSRYPINRRLVMFITRRLAGGVMMTAAMLSTGCMPEFTAEDLHSMRPERPVELDRLNMLAGDWTSTGTMKVIGVDEPVEIQGKSRAEWQADGWYLVEQAEYRMGGGEPSKIIGIWTWDERKEVYRSWFFDSMGSQGAGTAKYDPETNSWKIKAKGRGAIGRTKGRGTMRFSGDTIEWTWKEYSGWDVFRLITLMDMKGVSTRNAEAPES